MENKISFLKATHAKIMLIVLLLIILVFVVLSWKGLWKQQEISVSPKMDKTEIPISASEEKSRIEEKLSTVLERKFTIQVASFQDNARAEIVANGLKQKGYQPVISSKELPDKVTWYRVFVGDFATAEEARSLLNRLKEDHKDSFIKLK